MSVKKNTKKEAKNTLEFHRKELALIDDEIITRIFTRNHICEEIAKIKFAEKVKIKQPEIWDKNSVKRINKIKKMHLNKKQLQKIFNLIHKESIQIQKRVFKELKNGRK